MRFGLSEKQSSVEMQMSERESNGQLDASLQQIVSEIRARNATLSIAESLTGGLLSAAFVSVPGVSEIYRGGVVSYTNEIKAQVLGVDAKLLAAGGAVQAEVAVQMAAGVANLCQTDYALATTGVAGPGPAAGKPQGTVFIGVCTPSGSVAAEYHFAGNREEVRESSVVAAISLLMRLINSENP